MENNLYTGAEKRIPEILCDYLSGSGSVFLPETWREGAVCVSMTGGHEVYSEYVDGSYLAGIPFDVRIRKARSADSIADKLDAAAFFAALEDYLHDTPMPAYDGQLRDMKVLPASGKPYGGACHKSAVHEDGTEEYRAGYLLKFYVKKE